MRTASDYRIDMQFKPYINLWAVFPALKRVWNLVLLQLIAYVAGTDNTGNQPPIRGALSSLHVLGKLTCEMSIANARVTECILKSMLRQGKGIYIMFYAPVDRKWRPLVQIWWELSIICS